MKISIKLEDTAPFVHPVLSLHGTGKETLESEYKEAIEQLRSAIDKFHAVTVHGRDYNQPTEYYKAADDKFRMGVFLEIVSLYLKSIYMPIRYSNDQDVGDYCVKEIERYIAMYNNSK